MQRSSARPAKWVALVLGATLLAVACQKPEEDLGLDLLPGDEMGVEVDTFTVHAFTKEDAPVRTSGLTRNLVGSYLDQQFGWMRAGLVAQLRLISNNIGQGTDPAELEPDSIVL